MRGVPSSWHLTWKALDIGTLLAQCCFRVADDGPTFTQQGFDILLLPDCFVCHYDRYTTSQSQTAVTAYFSAKQLPLLAIITETDAFSPFFHIFFPQY